ncbi:MAG: glyoxalase, partial [Mesorhizobium sp.]
TWESRGGAAPPAGTTGLHHVAFLYPTRAALAAALRRLRAAGVALTGANDHGGSEAVYVRDPDGNWVELYWDRPEAEWPRNPDGTLRLVSKPLDVDNLACEGASDR